MPLSDLIQLMLSVWWIVLPPMLFIFFKTFWKWYITDQYLKKLKWVLLEIKIPREVIKTPKSAEQIFVGIQGTQSAGNLIDQLVRGRVQEWFSFEIVSKNGYVFFYIYTQVHFRNLIEANVYTQYPEAEIIEAEDYTQSYSVNAIEKEIDLWGTEMMLAKPNPYPIRTYSYFDFDSATEVEKAIDPLGSLTEIMGSLKPGEEIWFQVLIMPLDDSWKASGEELVQKLMNRKTKGGGISLFGSALNMFSYFVQALNAPPESKIETKEEKSTLLHLSPGEQEVVKGVENKLSKLGFATKIRWMYIAKKEAFTKPRISAVFGSIKQFNSLNLNSLKPDNRTRTKIDYLMIRKRELYRKRLLLHTYKNRSFPPNTFILNTEELASVYHFPGTAVSTPTLSRVEAKRGTPPPTLPTME